MARSTAMSRKMARKIAATDPRLKTLTPQARKVLSHLSTTGTISQREAIMDLSVQSLTRRITEIRDAGFKIAGDWKLHPSTGQRYMRYSFGG